MCENPKCGKSEGPSTDSSIMKTYERHKGARRDCLSPLMRSYSWTNKPFPLGLPIVLGVMSGQVRETEK